MVRGVGETGEGVEATGIKRTVKPVSRGHSKRDKTKVLKTI